MRATAAPSISVAVLSHRRPHLLVRVLTGVAQLDYPNFEIVVVGDQARLSDYNLPAAIARQIKYVSFPEANICRSRNLAIEAAAGEIVAFIDDDAVPEPDWLTHLAKAFVFPNVGGVGGLVRASDGLTIEWAGGVFDRAATEKPMKFADDLRVFDAETQVMGNEFVGTMGANSAFRREAVLSVGGFDEAFRYYLDETDLMLRLAEAGWDAALARTAEVHHLREENDARGRLRTPRNLFEIAASKAYFCRRHLKPTETMPVLNRFRAERREELDPHVRLGLLRQADCDRLNQQLADGTADGLKRERMLPMMEAAPTGRFMPFQPVTAEFGLGVALVTGWGINHIRSVAGAAKLLARAGFRVSCFSFISGSARRQVSFEDGVWMHRGGTWRFDHRSKGRVLLSRKSRSEAEISRVAGRRRFNLVLRTKRHSPKAREILLPGMRRPLFATAMPGSSVRFEEAVTRLQAGIDREKRRDTASEGLNGPQNSLEAALKATTSAG